MQEILEKQKRRLFISYRNHRRMRGRGKVGLHHCPTIGAASRKIERG